jgi:hypothetical protein
MRSRYDNHYEKKCIEEWAQYVSKNTWNTRADLTLKPYLKCWTKSGYSKVIKTTFQEASKNTKWFLHRLNSIVYRNQYRRHNVALKCLVSFEDKKIIKSKNSKGVYEVLDVNPHIHILFERPGAMLLAEFRTSIIRSWSRSKLGWDINEVSEVTSQPASIVYNSKLNIGAVDVENTRMK